ncbi:hypothetical protein ElyMa_006545700 [Elysia marginata]|uniref:Uncharacterized protein n=1 Tax=Elysia marginata TaxID=1093978 RepID=A0AAV4IAI7_9GAST|nr:hypothetical protein ElyMa_006545700 [Elysia marginata]
MSFLFRRDGSWFQKNESKSSVGSKNKVPQARIHFLRKIRSIQGVTEAYASDKRTTFVKLENQRIICLKGYNANPLYDSLREMYRAQDNEQFLSYLQGSKSSGATSSSDKQRKRYRAPAYEFGVSCSDNVRDYVLKKKFPGRATPRSTSSGTSLMSGSQSSLDGPNLKTPPQGGSSSGYVSEKPALRRGSTVESDPTPMAVKVPLLWKALRELKGTEYNDDKYRRAALRQIDEYMKNSLNMDFVQLFTDSLAMTSSGVYDDEDEDIYNSGTLHHHLKQYENLPYKDHFPPLTTFSDESDDDEQNDQTVEHQNKNEQRLSTEPVLQPFAGQTSQRRNSDQTDKILGALRKMQTTSPGSQQRRNTIDSPQKKPKKLRFIKVYRPGHSRPIFISGATTLGGLPEPSDSTEKRLSDNLKHKPISATNLALREAKTETLASSCPLFCEAEESEAQLAAGYGQTSSLSESYIYGIRYKWDDSDSTQEFVQKNLQSSRTGAQLPKVGVRAPKSEYDTSFAMEKSLQEANDLVRTLFDNLSIGRAAPVITVASSSTGPQITSVSPSTVAAATVQTADTAASLIPSSAAAAVGQISQLPEQDSSISKSSASISSHSEERETA